MPAAAFALLGVFIVVSIGAGTGAWWVIGPRSGWALPLPILAAFGVLYLVGHLLDWSVGPTVTLFGFDVALPFEIGLAAVVGVATAVGQRWGRGRLTPGGATVRR